jgi:repressor LexA
LCGIIVAKDVYVMTIGERIKRRRSEMGLTADAVAEALNKNRATIYRYESNDIEKLPTTVLEPLAKVLNTTPAYLMGWTNEESEKKNDAISDIILRLRSDDEFLDVVKDLQELSAEQITAVKNFLAVFKQ